MNRDDIIRMAREAGGSTDDPSDLLTIANLERFAALVAALNTQVHEPVAWMVYTLDGESVCVTDNPRHFTPEHNFLPLYTTPLHRKPLTDEEIDRIIASNVTITDQNLRGAVYMAMRELEEEYLKGKRNDYVDSLISAWNQGYESGIREAHMEELTWRIKNGT